MVEVAALVVLIGIVVAVARPMLGSAMAEAKLEAAVSDMETAFHYAQQASIRTGRDCRITIDSVAETILVEQIAYQESLMTAGVGGIERAKAGGGEYEPMKHPVRKWADYRINFTEGDRYRGVDIAVALFGADSRVVFDRVGRPSVGGGVALVIGESRAALILNAVTGRLSRING